jgi:hypothetical protein
MEKVGGECCPNCSHISKPVEQKEKERTPHEIAKEIGTFWWEAPTRGHIDSLVKKVEEALQSERLLREKVEGELDKLKKDIREVFDLIRESQLIDAYTPKRSVNCGDNHGRSGCFCKSQCIADAELTLREHL